MKGPFNAAFECVGLQVWIGDRQLTPCLTLNCTAGDTIALVGRNGSGKSLISKAVAGVDLSKQGYEVHGHVNIPAALTTGYSPQDASLFPWLTLLENVLLPARKRRSPESVERARNLLEGWRLTNGDKYPRALSGGERARVSICRAVITEPELLILDESSANLDAFAVSQLANVLKRRNQLGHSNWLVTHDLRLAIEVADKIVVFNSPADDPPVLKRTDSASFSLEAVADRMSTYSAALQGQLQ